MLLEKYRYLTHSGGMTARKMIGKLRNLRIPYPVQFDASPGSRDVPVKPSKTRNIKIAIYQPSQLRARILDPVVTVFDILTYSFPVVVVSTAYSGAVTVGCSVELCMMTSDTNHYPLVRPLWGFRNHTPPQ